MQLRLEMYNAFNSVIYNSRVTQLQLVSPQNQTIRNSQFLANGDVDPARLRTTAAGFGAVNGALRHEIDPGAGSLPVLDRLRTQ